MLDSSRTSRWNVKISGGLRLADLAAWMRDSLTPESKGSIELRAISEAPASANECAVARPMPLDAPVMNTAWPVWSPLVGSMAG